MTTTEKKSRAPRNSAELTPGKAYATELAALTQKHHAETTTRIRSIASACSNRGELARLLEANGTLETYMLEAAADPAMVPTLVVDEEPIISEADLSEVAEARGEVTSLPAWTQEQPRGAPPLAIDRSHAKAAR